MISVRNAFLRIALGSWLLIVVGCSLSCGGQGQPPAPSQNKARQDSKPVRNTAAVTLPALLVSDIHFDPFHDPAAVQQLVDASVSEWNGILAAPSSSNALKAFADLQKTCKMHGADTSYAVLVSSLQAMRKRQPKPRFITVSGDLIAHAFFCRYKAVFPESTQSDYQAFVLKTMSFVMGELRAGFPGVPIYLALGNNDTPCDDYRLDAGSDFLRQAGKIVSQGLPSAQQLHALKDFSQGGYYSVPMPAPMRDTRLIVIDDLFMSSQYSTCAGKPDTAGADAEIAWLRETLAEARRLRERVWVMGHIPPGVDPYSTAARLKDICGKEAPVMFLSSDKLADLLIEYADVIRLGLFAHSHMDEIRLLKAEGSDSKPASNPAGENGVAIKMVPSISPIDGNNPSFTVARIDPDSAKLKDYEVIAASNQTGIATIWSREYDFGRTYHQAEFSSAALRETIAGFANDRDAKDEVSKAYIRNFYAGDRSDELTPFWPEYICALANYTAKAFAVCACAAGK